MNICITIHEQILQVNLVLLEEMEQLVRQGVLAHLVHQEGMVHQVVLVSLEQLDHLEEMAHLVIFGLLLPYIFLVPNIHTCTTM